MKHRVKFRIIQTSGNLGKIAINLNEAEVFVLTDSVLGVPPSPAGPKTYAHLSVKNLTTHLHAASDSLAITVNDKPGTEFTLKPGDLLKVAGIVVEFLELPHVVADQENQTQYIDLSELKRLDAAKAKNASSESKHPAPASNPVSATVSASVFAPAPAIPTPPAESESELPDLTPLPPMPPAEPEKDLERVSRTAREYAPLTGLDQDFTSSLRLKSDWQRKTALGGLAALLAIVGISLFRYGTQTTEVPPTGATESPDALAQLKQTEPTPAAAVESQTAQDHPSGLDASLGSSSLSAIRKSISESRLHSKTRTLAMDNHSFASTSVPFRAQFFSAVRYGDLKTIRKLVYKKQIDPLIITESGATPLMQSAYYGHLDVMKYFVSKKLNINAQDPHGATALMFAVRGNQAKAATYLLKSGADPKIQKKDGMTALDVAKKSRYSKLVKILQAALEPKHKSSAHGKNSRKKSRKTASE